MLEKAKKAGHSKKTIYRASKKLGVVKKPKILGQTKKWLWSLPKAAEDPGENDQDLVPGHSNDTS